MAKNPPVDTSQLQIPSESALLCMAYETSGLIVSAMSRATGTSTAAIHIAMNGFRYRAGVPTVVSSPDNTLVKLAAVLQIVPEMPAEAGRGPYRQATSEIPADQLPAAEDPEQIESMSMTSGRPDLARQVLGVFSTEELRAEVQRRKAKLADEELYRHDDAEDSAFSEELAEDPRTEQWTN